MVRLIDVPVIVSSDFDFIRSGWLECGDLDEVNENEEFGECISTLNEPRAWELVSYREGGGREKERKRNI